jgi:predicted nucleic acid-binding protein
MNYFIDTSALIKCYSSDGDATGETRMTQLLASEAALFISIITRVEVVSAIARKGNASPRARRQSLRAIAKFDADSQASMRLIQCSEGVLDTAHQLAKTGSLFGCDAIQLATGLQVAATLSKAGSDPLVFVSSDKALNKAGTLAGLMVEDPSQPTS